MLNILTEPLIRFDQFSVECASQIVPAGSIHCADGGRGRFAFPALRPAPAPRLARLPSPARRDGHASGRAQRYPAVRPQREWRRIIRGLTPDYPRR